MTTNFDHLLTSLRWVAIAAIGLLGLAFVVSPPTARNLLLAIGLMDPLPAAASSPDALAYIDFVYGVLGSVMVGWVSAYALMLHSSQPIDRIVTWSFALWFVLDTLMSLTTGHPRNALLNVVSAGAFLVPHVVLSRGREAAQPQAGTAGATNDL